MTSTICSHPAVPRTDPGSLGAAAGPGLLAGIRQRLVSFGRHASRLVGQFWGRGSVTPSSEALEAVDVPSFHR